MHLNYYQIIGIPNDYPQDKIPQAFRNRARQVHPDKCKQQHKIDVNKQATILLLQAYRVLSNSQTRREYDLHLQIEHQESQMNNHRYFQHTNIVEKNGKLYVQCQQCMGDTEIASQDLLKMAGMEQHSYFVKCWHCGLSLTVDLE